MRFVARSLVASKSVLAGRRLGSERAKQSKSLRQNVARSEALITTQATYPSSPWNRLPWAIGGLVCGVGLFATSRFLNKNSGNAESKKIVSPNWHEEFAMQRDLKKVRSPRQVLLDSPVTKSLVKQDNLFDKMMEVEMVRELHHYYDPKKKEFHSIVHLGKEVCGYPNTVHGGLTAAIVDETFGGLMFNVWTEGHLGLSLPAVTAHLEVDYLNRLPQNSIVLCTAKLEGERKKRKIWMEAELTDQSTGTTYATARACFVSPSLHKTGIQWLKGVFSG